MRILKFKVGDRVVAAGWPRVGVVSAVDPEDDEFPYQVEFDYETCITEDFNEITLSHAEPQQ